MMRKCPNRSVLSSGLTCALLAASFPVFAGPAPVVKRIRRHQKTARLRYGVFTFADTSEGDAAAFEDPIVREASIRGLGRYNGSVVAIDPNSGRILTIVNQKLAVSACFKPCSTINA